MALFSRVLKPLIGLPNQMTRLTMSSIQSQHRELLELLRDDRTRPILVTELAIESDELFPETVGTNFGLPKYM